MSYKKTPKRILISRTDNLGDVILTLPMLGVLKHHFPQAELAFLGKKYTQPILKQCQHVDQIFLWEESQHLSAQVWQQNFDTILHVFPHPAIAQLAKQANIPCRIGSAHRVFHWWTCTDKLFFSRKKSDLHEAQLNLKLLAPLGITQVYSLPELTPLSGWKKEKKELPFALSPKKNIVFHPKSKGSAMEWPLAKYDEVAQQLPAQEFQIYLTGTKAEQELMEQEGTHLMNLPHVTSVAGKLTLSELIHLVHQVDGLVACSTGPLHIAAVAGIHALGLYPPVRPMHPARWAPLGEKATYLMKGEETWNRRQLRAIDDIHVHEVLTHIQQWNIDK